MKIELRQDNTVHLTGYVNVAERESRPLVDNQGEFVEVIGSKTFARALEKNEVGLMYNHMRELTPLNFDLYEDNIGLYADVVINDREIYNKARKNKLTGWSFGFSNAVSTWSKREDGMRLRKINDLDLKEVSILSVTPAYIATSIECRDGKENLKEYRQEETDKPEIITDERPTLDSMVEGLRDDNTPDLDYFNTQYKYFESLKIR
ncbi:hypothetical protein SAMN02745671_02554 [Anaerovibrio lipolyticus DSM 3074]|uniref:Prohead serine protease domain-containing protein n=1 Tax=Anaerovibrio lipolyticus DSM 3074 TaxID=1120997 RepID=A0A1M6G7N8_9FIRM|nr:HK97 family phage prohead protease [Anaerovibrio lipolyticus]SHJ05924.1 hypothetical protein SAMN02745671_02554 [Anaerovibrio lipolyticus DSM 3074]